MKTHNIYHAFVISIGFILSPLSWWNDLVVNVPLAYLLSYPFSVMDDTFFLTSFVLAYWFTNLLGLLMLYWGGENLFSHNKYAFRLSRSLIISIIYSLLIIILVYQGWLESPASYMQTFLK